MHAHEDEETVEDSNRALVEAVMAYTVPMGTSAHTSSKLDHGSCSMTYWDLPHS